MSATALRIVTGTAAEQSRACYPDEQGFVERDGIRLFYEVYGNGEPTVFLLPTWSATGKCRSPTSPATAG